MIKKSYELFNRPGAPIRGDVRLPQEDGAYPAILICHGFKGFKDWGFFPYLAEKICDAGYVSVSFNFSGSGIGDDMENFTELDKFAENTFSKEIDDLGIVLDAIMNHDIGDRKIDLNRIGVVGHSRGGAIAILRSRLDDRIKCLVTWSAIASVDRFSQDQVKAWEDQGYNEILNTRTGQMMRINIGLLNDVRENKSKLDIIVAVKEMRVPHLIVHGGDDEAVPVADARKLYDASGKEKTGIEIIAGAGHTFGAEHPFEGSNPYLDKAIQKTIGWFNRWMDFSGR